MAIEWRSIPGWEGLYEVSSEGAVRSLARTQVRANGVSVSVRGRILKPTIDNGYPRVALNGRKFYIHHLVCMAWHGARPDGCEVAHGNGLRTDNRPDNLRWATRGENMRDKLLHATQPCGPLIHLTKLSEGQAKEALRSNDSHKAIAAKFGVTPATIWAIRTGKSWKHLRRAA